ncbi:MAG: hypothetical protein JNK04_16890 [Myxococcales bacterium]|nr:hypothetical protein [Myxococcales bacterium]
MSRTALWLAVPCAAALAACAASTPTQTEPTAEATAVPEVTAEPTSVPSSEPTASATATAEAPPASTLPPPSGRPPLLVEKTDKITDTFGATPAAKLVLKNEGGWFRIPEHALNEGILVTFMIDKKAPKKAKGGAGSIYRLNAQVPPAEESRTITSRGPAFELRLPTAKVASPNLAVGEAGKDDKGKDTIVWKVIAPKKTEEGFATFELTAFTNPILQITNEAPN